MKNLKTIVLFFIASYIIGSCKKNNETTNPINWSEELKSSVWAGEFKYSTGNYTGLQPFSIVLNADGTLTWSDIQNSRPGGAWTNAENKITIKFPNATSLTADVSKEAWSNFGNPPINGFEVVNLSRSAIPTNALLDNTNWKGNFDAGILECSLAASNKIQISSPFVRNDTYSIQGAGIKINNFTGSIIANPAYFIFSNNQTSIKGYCLRTILPFPPAVEITYRHILFTATKQ